MEISIQNGNHINLLKLHSISTDGLKPNRKQAIDEFVKSANLELNSILDINQSRSCCLLKFYSKLKTLESEFDPFLAESFDALESKLKSSFKIEQETFKSNKNENKKDKQSKKSVLVTDNNNDENKDDAKKKLKGADLIFQRIKWDTNINKDQIIIGYLDRFLGVKDIKFNDFKGVHEDKDGVPFHRIRYFKINEKIVWDRENRIDLLTGADDLIQFFSQNQTIDASISDVKIVNNQFNIKDEYRNGTIYQFKSDKWFEINENNLPKNVPFVDTFKILTYNIMSNSNFKRSIEELIKVTAHETGLNKIHQTERMSKIVDLLQNESFDLISLQECEELEENQLRQTKFIQDNYYILSSGRENKKIEHSNCVILSKWRPIFYKLLSLSEKSNKEALIVKFELRNSSMKKIETVLLVNLHLTSDKSNNSINKRVKQLEKLKEYIIDRAEEFELKSDYTFITGDFNFDDQDELAENEYESIKSNFIGHNFQDICTNVKTFDPKTNLTASLTSRAKKFARRLDRILLRKNSTKCTLVKSCLVNTKPFKLDTSLIQSIQYESYNNIKKHRTKNNIETDDNDCSDLKEIDNNEYYLHPSDHFGLACTFKFQNSLHESNIVHKSALAILLPKHNSELVQQIRSKYDAQHQRWPPHINLLYPFYDSINFRYVNYIGCQIYNV